jgi:tungstate transport system ATP-binding protein
MSSPKLTLRDLTVEKNGHVILDIPSLDITSNEVLAVLGPNGSGKSTFLQVLALLENPSTGRVLFDGSEVGGNPLAYRRRMAVAFQEPLLLDTTVEGNVRSGLRIRGAPFKEQKRRAAEWLDRFGIAALAQRSSRFLSGGEAQRTSLARALALQPEVLLLDEPFAALDTPTRSALIEDLDRILTESRTTTVLVTHDRSEALRLGDRVAIMIDGRIHQLGPPEEVFSAPADEAVAAFVGVETIVPATIRGLRDGVATLDVAGVTLEAATTADLSPEVLLCIRPEDVVIAAAGRSSSTTSARNHIPAVIARITPSGPYSRIELDVGFSLVALITKQSLEDLALIPGARVQASFKATAAHLIPRRPQ